MLKLLRLMLPLATLILAACGGGSKDSSDPYAVALTKLTEQDYETSDLILYFQHITYPSNSAVVVDDKLNGNLGCTGRLQTTQGANTFVLFNFVGACAGLNKTYTYRLTTACQGYTQATYVCGSTATVEIVLQ